MQASDWLPTSITQSGIATFLSLTLSLSLYNSLAPFNNVRPLQTHNPRLQRSSLVFSPPSMFPPLAPQGKQVPNTPPPTHRKIPWRLSPPQKRRQRKRLRMVDNVVAVVDAALRRNAIAIAGSTTATPTKKKKNHLAIEGGPETMEMGIGTTKNLERWKAEMPTEAEMRPKDKYTFFDRKERGYRKGVHSEFYFPSGRGFFWVWF